MFAEHRGMAGKKVEPYPSEGIANRLRPWPNRCRKRPAAVAYVDQGYTGPNAAEAALEHGLRLEFVKHPMAKRGFVLLPRRWVVEGSFAWAARFRRLARDYERLDSTLKGLHLLAFATLMLRNLAHTLASSS